MPLWIDAIVFHVVVIWGWSICYVFRVHSLGVAPRCGSPRVYEIDEVSGTDPLLLYAEFLRYPVIGRSSWLYGGVVEFDEIRIWVFDDLLVDRW